MRSRNPGSLGELAPPPDTTLPNGFAVELDPDVRRSRDGGLMLGGSPLRLLRLSKRATRILEPGRFAVADAITVALARRLVDFGVVHPRPVVRLVQNVTIVIPVLDRTCLLHQLLSALRADPETSAVPVVVVDDGSMNSAAVASVARLHGATLLVHQRNRGPAAARNTGLRNVGTPFIAFCDSDVLPEPGWLSPLLAQFTDPALALAAPTVVGVPHSQPRRLDRYEDIRSPLDMGLWRGVMRDRTIAPLIPRLALRTVRVRTRRAAGRAGAGFACLGAKKEGHMTDYTIHPGGLRGQEAARRHVRGLTWQVAAGWPGQ